jgi:hypothetical protein
MATAHEKLKEAAFKAVDALHTDRSVSLRETWDDLGELRDHVEMLLDAVANSMPRGDE